MEHIKAYHYSDSKIKKFNLKHIEEKFSQYGPGIYFSDIPINRGAYTYTVELTPRKLITNKGRGFSKKEIIILMKNSPTLDDKLLDWAEDPQKAFNLLYQSIIDSGNKAEQFQTIWWDVYGKDNSIKCLKEFVKLGYDGEVIKGREIFLNRENTYYIIFNPKIIKIIDGPKFNFFDNLLEDY